MSSWRPKVPALLLSAAALLMWLPHNPVASAQSAQAPLLPNDLGPEWLLANEVWFEPPDGPGVYTAHFQRDARQGLASRGPVAVNVAVEVLRETPPSDVVEMSMAGYLAAASPPGGVRVTDNPTIGRSALWYNFDVDLSAMLPEQEVPPGIVHGVIFGVDDKVVNVTTVGFAPHLAFDEVEPIVRTVANRIPAFQLVGAAP
jgi:hypothetical protein